MRQNAKDWRIGRVIRVVIVFFAVVIAGTFMSRFANSALTPRVETMYASSGTVSRDVLQDVIKRLQCMYTRVSLFRKCMYMRENR